jgi:hypothetical protein
MQNQTNFLEPIVNIEETWKVLQTLSGVSGKKRWNERGRACFRIEAKGKHDILKKQSGENIMPWYEIKSVAFLQALRA